MSKLITRFAAETSDDVELKSKFACLQQILIRTQAAQGERAIALASMETVEAEMNRRRARMPRLAP
jgi:hypothetical protein